MNGKMKACFTPHVYMHSAIGFGLGMIVADLFVGFSTHKTIFFVGLAIVVVAEVLDQMRKQ